MGVPYGIHLERHAINSKRHSLSNRMVKRAVMIAVDSTEPVDRMARMEKKLEQLMVVSTKDMNQSGKICHVCDHCGELGHSVPNCGAAYDGENREEVNYV